MARTDLWWALARVAASILGAGVLYAAWMAVFLTAARSTDGVLRALLWLLAPVATASGFAAGIVLFERLARGTRVRFFERGVWPLVACSIGAAAVFRFGPMLIVFGMFSAGTFAVLAQEYSQIRGAGGRAVCRQASIQRLVVATWACLVIALLGLGLAALVGGPSSRGAAAASILGVLSAVATVSAAVALLGSIAGLVLTGFRRPCFYVLLAAALVVLGLGLHR